MKPLNAAKVFLVIFYLVGLAGLGIETTKPLFTRLVPLSLLLSTALVLLFDTNRSIRFLSICALVYLLGFTLEAIGVNTGVIFGHYLYGTALGPVIFDTPLIIGMNWLILIYCSYNIFFNTSRKLWLTALLGAMVMVMYDILLEPVAIKLSWWTWLNGAIPLQNFIAWFLFSFILLIIMGQARIRTKNPLAAWLFMIQLIFFLMLNIIL